ncbi:SDR family oxidoreductase [Azospirillum rugosum]|uniref:Citronellol/citronellal dehydrogenase n=1 Tax=Azospirillum rugosum TaxID=416170 RepID=A0ABS4SS47_9PROT|nr:NAD(P)-dependent oxidoreductase [Azospirillum rugosum]MBP2294923.1 citronellol/citronellal dehydrogenase [Azospirillum rugosum]MDQ0528155.1 citronellol/citronellal dehydrogenase [Azospirillum rugosum]
MTGTWSLQGKTLFITGASRGIGKAIALRAARDGASIAIAAKTAEPHPKLPGTIYSAAEEIEAAGGKALPILCDIRDEAQVADAVAKTVQAFGGIDILVNNASAISLTGTLETPMKRWDLMMGVNGRGTFACSQACLPHLLKADNPHILTLSPPLNLSPRWFQHHTAYTIAKYAMSLCTLGMSAEFRGRVAVNSLWPRTIIGTAAVAMLKGAAEFENCRKPDILADAAHAILTRDAKTTTGHFFIDDEVLAEEGITNLDQYAVQPGAELAADIFLD